MKARIAVVILNWNGEAFLEKFLPVVIEKSVNDALIVVADNDSKDGSVKLIKEKFPQVQLIRNQSNGGFAKGYNDALKLIDADYYVLLNSDVEVSDNWIYPVIELMESDHSIAACQPKIKSYSDKQNFEYAGACGGYIDKFGYPFCRGRIFDSLESDQGQYNSVEEVFWATGACLFVRSEVFHQLGGFDERFFAHMEEIDFCWRAKRKGFKIMVQPASEIFHIGGGTLSSTSPFKTYLNIRNNQMMLFKNLPFDKLFSTIILRLLLDGVAAIKFLADGGWKQFYAVIKAHFAFYRKIPILYKERKEENIQQVSDIYQKNIVLDFYVRKKKKFTDLKRNHFS